MINKKSIIESYKFLRKHNNDIAYEVLDFMKNESIKALDNNEIIEKEKKIKIFNTFADKHVLPRHKFKKGINSLKELHETIINRIVRSCEIIDGKIVYNKKNDTSIRSLRNFSIQKLTEQKNYCADVANTFDCHYKSGEKISSGEMEIMMRQAKEPEL